MKISQRIKYHLIVLNSSYIVNTIRAFNCTIKSFFSVLGVCDTSSDLEKLIMTLLRRSGCYLFYYFCLKYSIIIVYFFSFSLIFYVYETKKKNNTTYTYTHTDDKRLSFFFILFILHQITATANYISVKLHFNSFSQLYIN